MPAAIAIVWTAILVCLGYGSVLAQTSDRYNFGWLHSLRMFDEKTGWAVSAEGWSGVYAKGAVRSVVRTIDGGIHWRDVTPQRPFGANRIGWLTARSAWVAAAAPPPASRILFHTVDGGQTWKDVMVSLFGLVDFINTRDGWLVSGNDVYRSTDGGQTWVKVGSAEFPGRPEGVTFLSATTGWISGSSAARDGICLLVTRDGGHTWQKQKLPLPQRGTSLSSFCAAPYRFFTPKDGILSQADISYVAFYVTHDGGTTWMPTTPVTFTQGNYRGGASPMSITDG